MDVSDAELSFLIGRWKWFRLFSSLLNEMELMGGGGFQLFTLFFFLSHFSAPYSIEYKGMHRETTEIIRKEGLPGYNRVCVHVGPIFTQRKDFKVCRARSSLDPAWLKSILRNLCLSNWRQVCVSVCVTFINLPGLPTRHPNIHLLL